MEKLKFIKQIGRGTHGTVYLFEDENDILLAVKSIPKKARKQAINEIEIIKSISHPNIIKYFYHFELNGSILITLEYMNYGTLGDLILFFTENKLNVKNWLAWSLLIQMIDALVYIHSYNIIHRDIKPTNILMHRNSNNKHIIFKLCDFSLSISTNNNSDLRAYSMVGTPYYMAPEIVKKAKYNTDIDVWGLGVCLLELFTLKHPFNGTTNEELAEQIISTEILKVQNCKDKDLERIILSCIQKHDRPSSFNLSHIPSIFRKSSIFKARNISETKEEEINNAIKKKLSMNTDSNAF